MAEKLEITTKSNDLEGCSSFVLSLVVGALGAWVVWHFLGEFVELKKDVAAIKEQIKQKAEK